MGESRTTDGERGRHVLLYDGECGLCSRVVQFVLPRDRYAVFVFAPLQSPVGRELVTRSGGDPDDLTSFYVIADFRGERSRALRQSAAALFVASELGWPWTLVNASKLLPARVRDAMYARVARHRHRVFGRVDECPVPPPEWRDRFLDS